MVRVLIAVIAGLGVLLAHAAPSEACGVKLPVPGAQVRSKAISSSNPSRILLVGAPPRRLARRLSNAGHQVEVARTPQAARRTDYPVVMADKEHVEGAREQFPGSRVIPREGGTSQDAARIEDSLQRAPRNASGRRVARRVGGREREPVAAARDRDEQTPDREPVSAAREREQTPDREPVATTRDRDEQTPDRERIGAANESDENDEAERERPEHQSPPGRDRVAARDSRDRDPARRRDRRDQPSHEDDAPAEFHDQINFRSNSARLSADARQAMRATAAWLLQNPNVQIVLEGHTDTPGNPEYNVRLSQRRAEATRDFLVSEGVDATRVEVEWYGEDRPAYGDGVDERNRRVELKR